MTRILSTIGEQTAVRFEFVVDGTPAEAFAEYVNGHDGWWPADHKLGDRDVVGIAVEPAEGGYWYERDADGGRVTRGRVLVWDPPHRLVTSFALHRDWESDPARAGASEVELTFTPNPSGGTVVDIEHRHLDQHGEMYPQFREALLSPRGWRKVIGDYTTQVDADAR